MEGANLKSADVAETHFYKVNLKNADIDNWRTRSWFVNTTMPDGETFTDDWFPEAIFPEQ
jgi:uncharacterized protein YjbI with pentapeptide repeats